MTMPPITIFEKEKVTSISSCPRCNIAGWCTLKRWREKAAKNVSGCLVYYAEDKQRRRLPFNYEEMLKK
jgi:hypothetical protein